MLSIILAKYGGSTLASGQKSWVPSSNSVSDTSLPHSSFIDKIVSKSVKGSQVST